MGNEIAKPFSTTTPTHASISALFPSKVDLGPSVDLLDPESMLAFFEMKMGDAKGKLNSLIQEQEQLNNRVTNLQSLEASLQKFAEKGVKPGDAGWEEFVGAAREAQEMVGASSKAGQDIQALIDQATKPTMIDKEFRDFSEALEAAKAHGGNVRTEMESLGVPVFKVSVPEGPAPGITKENMASLGAQVKAFREGLQSDSQIRMIRVQQGVEQCSQLVNLASNIMRKLNEMAMAPINNMRG